MTPYRHRVNYYETDKMGITHHANYLHWMEEARIDFLDQLGWGYDKLEQMGVVSPVIALDCAYHATTTFHDEIDVTITVQAYNGVRLTVGYEMQKKDGTRVFSGSSTHCFLDQDGRFRRMKRDFPDLDAKLRELAAEA